MSPQTPPVVLSTPCNDPCMQLHNASFHVRCAGYLSSHCTSQHYIIVACSDNHSRCKRNDAKCLSKEAQGGTTMAVACSRYKTRWRQLWQGYLVTALQGGPHDLNIPNALKGVVDAAYAVVVRHLHDDFLHAKCSCQGAHSCCCSSQLTSDLSGWQVKPCKKLPVELNCHGSLVLQSLTPSAAPQEHHLATSCQGAGSGAPT